MVRVIHGFWNGSAFESLPSLARGLAVVPWCGLVVVRGVDRRWRVWVFSLGVFMAVPWCGLRVVRFQSAMMSCCGLVGSGWSQSHIDQSNFFSLAEICEFGVSGCFD